MGQQSVADLHLWRKWPTREARGLLMNDPGINLSGCSAGWMNSPRPAYYAEEFPPAGTPKE